MKKVPIRKIKKACFEYLPLVLKTGAAHAMPFLYDMMRLRPASATVFMTDRCNLRCVMCRQWRQEHGYELNYEEWVRIFDDLAKNHIKNIHFTGGEPLLRKDLADLVGYLSRKGFVVGMTTNGTLLDNKALDALVKAGLKSAALSIDALGEEYGSIRGVPGSFEKVRQAALGLAALRSKGLIDAYINFTLFKKSMKSFKDVKRFADETCLPVSVCLLDDTSFLFALEENRNDFWIRSDEDMKELDGLLDLMRKEKKEKPHTLLMNYPGIDYIKNYFREPRQKAVPCVSSQDRIVITPAGDLLGGCMAMGSFGSLRAHTYKELSEAKKYISARKNMFYKKCPGCSCMYQFNLRCMPGMLIRDLAARVRR